MNITKSYKTLDLKTGAPIDDVRKAYKDMVRVWHPDRFAGNIRLRAKANEKLKEINFAYSEIQKFWAKDCRIHSDTEKAAPKKSVPHVDHKAGLFLRKILGFPFSVLNSLTTNPHYKKYYREFIFSRMTTEMKPQAPSKQYSSKLHRSFASRKAGRVKRKYFSEILDEVARSKKKNVAYTEKSNKGKHL
jgi:DnaJ-class molecular chaperone